MAVIEVLAGLLLKPVVRFAAGEVFGEGLRRVRLSLQLEQEYLDQE